MRAPSGSGPWAGAGVDTWEVRALGGTGTGLGVKVQGWGRGGDSRGVWVRAPGAEAP